MYLHCCWQNVSSQVHGALTFNSSNNSCTIFWPCWRWKTKPCLLHHIQKPSVEGRFSDTKNPVTRSGIATHCRSWHSSKTVSYPKTVGVKVKQIKTRPTGSQYQHYKRLTGIGSRKLADFYGQPTKVNGAEDVSLFSSCGLSLEESTDNEACPPPSKKLANTTTATAPEPPTTKSTPTPSLASDRPEVSTVPLTQDAETQTDKEPPKHQHQPEQQMQDPPKSWNSRLYMRRRSTVHGGHGGEERRMSNQLLHVLAVQTNKQFMSQTNSCCDRLVLISPHFTKLGTK